MILLFFSLNSFSQQFKVIGKIENIGDYGLKDGDDLTLRFLNPSKITTSVVKNGSFTFEGELKEPAVAMLNFKGSGVKLLLDTNTLQVILREKEIEPGKNTYLHNITTASPIHLNYTQFAAHQVSLNNQKSALLNRLDSLSDPNQISKTKEKLAALDFEMKQSFKDNAIQYNDNVAAAYVLTAAPDFSYQLYYPIYEQFTHKVKTSSFGVTVLEKLNALKALGTVNPIIDRVTNNKLPEFEMVDPSGKLVKLNDSFFAKQKYTLIEFWASWCGPCKLISNELRANEAAYQSKGLTIIGFSLDSDLASWKQGIAAENSKWKQYSDLKVLNSPLIKFLKITSIPANIIVDTQGTIMATNIYGDAINEFLKKH